MTTNLISAEYGTRIGRAVVSDRPMSSRVGVSACPMPDQRPRAAWLGLVAGKPIFHKSTRVSVPGCRGIT